jgi:hypothetical protein
VRLGEVIVRRPDGVDRWFAWRGLAGAVGFEPHQPILSRPGVSVAVPLTGWCAATSRCLRTVAEQGQQALDR